MIVERLELSDFRNYVAAAFELTSGVTAVVGKNGQGKTNFAEALAFLATLSSFRGAPPDALVRAGAETAIVRATLRDDDGREVLIPFVREIVPTVTLEGIEIDRNLPPSWSGIVARPASLEEVSR